MNKSEDSGQDENEFRFASFPIGLNLPKADFSLMETAAEAVRSEYRETTKWKKLRCRSVQLLSSAVAGTIYELQVGGAIDFDWTWEGAVAFRPTNVQEQPSQLDDRFSDDRFQADLDESVIWSGEILEVDEARGKIFIAIANPEFPPTTGSFFVRPFEFLAFLNAIFHESGFEPHRAMMAGRLLATEGGLHPKANPYVDVGLESLQHLWAKSWSVLWGPPGTGKTYTTGQQIAEVLADPSERILVVSTTNRATDAVALSIGRASADRRQVFLEKCNLLRIGKGASFNNFNSQGLGDMLKGTETELLGKVERLAEALASSSNSADKALIRNEIKGLRLKMRDAAKRNFFNRNVRVVISTAFRATVFLKSDELKELLDSKSAPFTTVMIDEAGLISRVSAASLSLLASRRVILVGDSKQLAPISRISRLLPRDQMEWLGSSSVSHLTSLSHARDGVHVLGTQYRMHKTIGNLISNYQYDGGLQTADEVIRRDYASPSSLASQPRTIWYVLDESGEPLPTIRADRGRGNRSWVRTASIEVLSKLFLDRTLCDANGIFMSPFKGQVQLVSGYFSSQKIKSWSAATVHSQQGSEADIVIFDSVNAGSYAWPYDEWKRLVSVAISRAREYVILLASRAEMNEPFLRPLINQFSSQVLVKEAAQTHWKALSIEGSLAMANLDAAAGPLFDRRADLLTQSFKESNSIGYQIASRKLLRPILSNEQQRLCNLDLDGKPRLVRGVAGSGKTVVLANWMMQILKQEGEQTRVKIWAIFANRSLQGLIGDSLQSVWDEFNVGKSFPWECVALHHVRELLFVLLKEVRLSIDDFAYDYDAAAKAYLEKVNPESIQTRCDAMFIDEAQDMGPNTLRLLSLLVKKTDETDLNSRAVNIFYDNAQNVYARATPTWSDLGLDMRGRSSVMKESYRSTKPVTEYAINVLYSLQPPVQSQDHRELVQRELLVKSIRGQRDWWTVKFNQIDGPKPTLHQYPTVARQIQEIGHYVRTLVEVEQVQPNDICIIYMGRRIKQLLEADLAPLLSGIGVELSVQTNVPFARHQQTLLASTPHSFKGYDSEVVIIPAADQFISSAGEIQANSLYVAMTRARSLLRVYAGVDGSRPAVTLIDTLRSCMTALNETPCIDQGASINEEWLEILDIIGPVHRDWLRKLWKEYKILQEPIIGNHGDVIAQPLFWFEAKGYRYACFGILPLPLQERDRLKEQRIIQLLPSQADGDNLA